MCRKWTKTGTCPYGDKCQFAHGKSELISKKIRNPHYKSKPCNSFHTKGFCTYGSRCKFIHDEIKDSSDEDVGSSYFQKLLAFPELKQFLPSRQRLPIFKKIQNTLI